ncbi:MAG TPA: HAD hydrolase-like protein [Candidatus Binataceae bacterium]|nr:HAD hydrolase-like protein [Candidatus Binataceae bacterium]
MIPPNPTAKLWLFDFDNTLAALECEVDWTGSRRELEAYLRSEGVDEPIFAEIPKGNLPLYSVLHSRWLRSSADSVASPPRGRAEALLRYSSEIIERHELLGAERAMPACGAIDLLRALAARAAVSIVVTSNSSRTVARWLDRHDVADLVHAIVGRDSLLALKPSPEMVARALALATTFAAEALASSSAADAVFVGDSLADLDAARAAGLGFYGIATTESARDRLLAAAATDIFTSPAALRIYLNL